MFVVTYINVICYVTCCYDPIDSKNSLAINGYKNAQVAMVRKNKTTHKFLTCTLSIIHFYGKKSRKMQEETTIVPSCPIHVMSCNRIKSTV